MQVVDTGDGQPVAQAQDNTAAALRVDHRAREDAVVTPDSGCGIGYGHRQHRNDGQFGFNGLGRAMRLGRTLASGLRGVQADSVRGRIRALRRPLRHSGE